MEELDLLKKFISNKDASANHKQELIKSNVKFNVKKVLLVANKCENNKVYEEGLLEDIYKLDMGEPIFISAEQGDGMKDLFEAIEEQIP